MKKYQVLISLLIGLPVIVLAISFVLRDWKAEPESPESVAHLSDASLPYERNEEDVTIDVQSTGVIEADQYLLAKAKQIEADFQKDSAAAGEAADWGMPPTLQIRSSSSMYDRYVNMVLDVYTYTGGAHGMPYVVTMVYDTQTNALATLNGVLGGPNALEVLAQAVASRILERDDLLEESMVRDALSPAATHYQSWTVSEEGLRVFFNPYEIAPFSSGIISVTVPWSELKS